MNEWWPILERVFSIFGVSSLLIWALNYFKNKKPDKADLAKKLLDLDKFYTEVEARFNQNLEDERKKMELVQQSNQKVFIDQTIEYKKDISACWDKIAEERKRHEFDMGQAESAIRTLREMTIQQKETIKLLEQENKLLREENKLLKEQISILENSVK